MKRGQIQKIIMGRINRAQELNSCGVRQRQEALVLFAFPYIFSEQLPESPLTAPLLPA